MSALDQAFIKAYGKPTARPPATQGATATAALATTATVVRRAAAPVVPTAVAAIETEYSEGALYRVDLPAAGGAAATRRLSSVPAPHHLAAGSARQAAGQRLVPPPTSPKRGVRRSVLRLLAGQMPEAPASEPSPAPRIQRKVIIRHVAHSQQAAGLVPPPHLAARALNADLPPEFATELPDESVAPALNPLTLPALPDRPAAAPENLAAIQELEFAPAAALVQCHWNAEANAVGPLVVLSESTGFADSENLVSVQLESLPDPQEIQAALVEELIDEDEEIGVAGEAGAEPIGFASKSLDDDRRSSARIDPPHARSSHRPHVRFGVPAELTPEEAESLTADLPTIHERPAATGDRPEATVVVDDEPATAEPFSFAPPPTAVWEVDQFKWPRVCERLLADEQGYLQGAGEKLLAAVNDGLKTLAVTGSRRGEGRTTLALCLARVAAKAGIRVVVLDADFARPQIASRLGLEISHGWQDVALGSLPLNEAAIKSLQDGVTVLPLEITAIRRSLSLSDPRVTSVLREASSAFDLVIVDLGPLGPGEVCAFPPGEVCPIDAAIVVRDLRFATTPESQGVGERLYDAGIEAVGIAENFVEDGSNVS